ncbi:MAG: histone deacetylase, partial [Thermoanaerobaculales bacterium]
IPNSEFRILWAIIFPMSSTTDRPLVSVRSHPWCRLHEPGLGHPDAPARLEVVLDALSSCAEGRWVVDRESPLPSEDDIIGALAWVHDRAYIERVREASEAGADWLDSHDCGVSAGTFRAAIAAAGLGLQAGLDLVNRRLRRAFVVARPPAHHAGRDRASGYCFFNFVALAAEVVTRSWVRPVVIADFGALHGNGTQDHFYDRGDVGYVSVHRFSGFPGTGGADEIGEGEGMGKTRNVPLAPGADDEVCCVAFERALEEICGRLRPAAILVSAGFDGLGDDPLGGMHLSVAGIERLTSTVVAAADRWSEGHLLSFLEGGFDLEALAKSARIHVEQLAATSRENPPLESPDIK